MTGIEDLAKVYEGIRAVEAINQKATDVKQMANGSSDRAPIPDDPKSFRVNILVMIAGMIAAFRVVRVVFHRGDRR